MDLSWSDEQRLLAETVRDVCERYASPEQVRALEDDPKGFSGDLWHEFANLGLTGLLISEEHGGAGATMLDVVAVCEELGRAIAPSPYIASSVFAAALLQDATLLSGISAGSEIVVPAWLESDRGVQPDHFETREQNGTIIGEKILVPFASSAHRLAVLAQDGGVYLVDPRGSGVSMTQQKTMAADASYAVTFDSAFAERLGETAWAEWDAALSASLIAVAAYATGAASRAHEMAVAYAKEREQFGKPIGAFQGIAHPLADTATDIEGARVLVWQAAWTHSTGKRDVRTLSAMAKMYACDVFKRTTKAGQQTFGGIGFIRDVDMQLYFRRAKQLELLWLGPRDLEERIAAAELDAAAPFVTIDT